MSKFARLFLAVIAAAATSNLLADTYRYGYDPSGNLTTVTIEAGAPPAPPGGSNPNADSDGDGIPDYQEMAQGTNPLLTDTDGDGLSDSQEAAMGTNPLAADTDGDGIPDGWEAAHGLNPLSAADGAALNGAGISNLSQYRISTAIAGLYAFDTAGEDTSGAQNSGAFTGGAGSAYDSARNRVMAAQGTAASQFALPRGTALDLAQDGDFAVAGWINPTAVGAEQTIFSKGDTALRIALSADGKVRLYFGDNSTAIASTTGTVTANQWIHLAASVSRATGTAKLYLNGLPDGFATVGSAPLATTYRSAQWLAGSDNTNGFGGYIDSLRFYTKALSDNDVAAIKKLDTVSTVAPSSLSTGLAAYYPFDVDGSDLTPGNRPATLLAGASISPGRVGSGSLSLNGTGAYAAVAGFSNLLPTLTDYSVGCWVNFQNPTSSWPRIWDFGSGTSSYVLLSPRSSATGPLYFNLVKPSVASYSLSAPSAVPTNSWHYVALTYVASSKTVTLYQDGVSVATNAGTAQGINGLTFTQNWIGRSQYSNDSYFKGNIDEFGVWSRTLTTAEVTLLANGGSPVFLPTAPSGAAAQSTAAASVSVSWTDNSSSEQSFLVERRAAGQSLFTVVGTAAMNATSFVDSSTVGLTTYTYHIRALNSFGASAPSNSVDVTTPAQ